MRDINKVGRWAEENLMDFKGKCQHLHLWRNNPRQQQSLEAKLLENSFVENGLGVHKPKLSIGQQHTVATKQANSILVCIRKGI